MWRVFYLESLLQANNSGQSICRRFTLGFCWILGLLIGLISGLNTAPSFISVMRGFSVDSVSIVCLLSSLFFSYGIIALAVYSSNSWIICAFSFMKGFSFSFVSCLLLYFLKGDILMRLFLMFYEILL